jgi:hypothetical protein
MHIAVVWILLAATQRVAMRSLEQSLQFVFVAPRVVVPESPVRRSIQGSQRIRRPKATRSSDIELNPVAPSEQGIPIRPSIDWAAELDRMAREAAMADTSRKHVDFGFPHASSAPTSSLPEFGWSYAPTHRVEAIPSGGLLVNLSDSCVLVFAPLPFFACAPGKKSANGDLFMHMRDPTQTGGGASP